MGFQLGTRVAADLADHVADEAVHPSTRELDYAQITSNYTKANGGVATTDDIAGLSVTVDTGDAIVIEFDTPQVTFSVNAGEPSFRIYEDGVLIKTRATYRAAAGKGDGVFFKHRHAPTPGTHTYKVTMFLAAAPNGTVTVLAGAASPTFIRVSEVDEA